MSILELERSFGRGQPRRGFIGSHLVERLVEDGAGVRALVHCNWRNHPGLLRLLPAELLTKSMCSLPIFDPHAVLRAVKGMHTVFHLGALISIPYSYRYPGHVAQTNVMGTLNVLDAC